MKRKESSKRPNVLLIMTDDQRFDTLRAVNNPEIITPNLDFLVRSGTIFTRAHIMGGSHEAVCMPSRAMMHTGRTLFHLQQEGQDIPKGHTLLGQFLGENGYKCFGTGKWHNGKSSFSRSFSDGAEIFFGGMDDHWNVPFCNYDPTGEYPPERLQPWNPGTGVVETIPKSFDHIKRGRHSTDLITDAAVSFLTNDSMTSPFFLYVAFMAPHDPRTMPQRYLNMYDASNVTLPVNYLPQHPFDNGEMEVRDEKLAPMPRQPQDIRRHTLEYYAMISHVDAAIGRILDALKASGEFENTVIVHTADHGLAIGRHGLMGKQNNYEHSVRIPLIFAGPGISRGQQRNTLCYNVDIFSTLCELLDLPIPESVEGTTLLPALLDASIHVRETLLHAYRGVQRSARNERYKLIEYVVDGERHTQLFDLQEDPNEVADLSDLPSSRELLEELRTELTRWQTELDDPHVEFWSAFNAGKDQ